MDRGARAAECGVRARDKSRVATRVGSDGKLRCGDGALAQSGSFRRLNVMSH